jgi:hypothetical protein
MVTFHPEDGPSNGGRVKSEVIFGDSDRRRWPCGAPFVTRADIKWVLCYLIGNICGSDSFLHQ